METEGMNLETVFGYVFTNHITEDEVVKTVKEATDEQLDISLQKFPTMLKELADKEVKIEAAERQEKEVGLLNILQEMRCSTEETRSAAMENQESIDRFFRGDSEELPEHYLKSKILGVSLYKEPDVSSMLDTIHSHKDIIAGEPELAMQHMIMLLMTMATLNIPEDTLDSAMSKAIVKRSVIRLHEALSKKIVKH